MKNLEIVSRVVNSLRNLTADGHISRRYVLNVLRGISKNLIAQKLMDRTIDSDINLTSLITCFELKKVDSVKCPIIDFRLCKILMKSKKKLPELIYSRLGSSIKEIVSVDNKFRLIVTSLEKYRRDKKRKYKVKTEISAYIDEEGYLYIPDHEIYAVNVRLITMNTESVTTCEDESCKSGWEYEFIVPDKLAEAVFKEGLNTLLGSYKQIQPDINPNTIEGR